MKNLHLVAGILVLSILMFLSHDLFSQDNSEEFLNSLRQGDPEMVQMLIKAGADVNSKTNGGKTALKRAEKIENAKLKDMKAVIDILKKSGAK
jgi:ankyrin repeat protein